MRFIHSFMRKIFTEHLLFPSLVLAIMITTVTSLLTEYILHWRNSHIKEKYTILMINAEEKSYSREGGGCVFGHVEVGR